MAVGWNTTSRPGQPDKVNQITNLTPGKKRQIAVLKKDAEIIAIYLGTGNVVGNDVAAHATSHYHTYYEQKLYLADSGEIYNI